MPLDADQLADSHLVLDALPAAGVHADDDFVDEVHGLGVVVGAVRALLDAHQGTGGADVVSWDALVDVDDVADDLKGRLESVHFFVF